MSELRTPAPKRAVPPTAEELETRKALQRLVSMPEWSVMIEYFRDRLHRETVDRTAPNVSALLMIEGRRSFHRELSDLPKRVTDDGRSNSGDG